ncbi:MAG: sel1 repeat family protein [SAR324 cluster bacterium]|nr:sel1 repeat family protein [SAR324 cluster bacterium]
MRTDHCYQGILYRLWTCVVCLIVAGSSLYAEDCFVLVDKAQGVERSVVEMMAVALISENIRPVKPVTAAAEIKQDQCVYRVEFDSTASGSTLTLSGKTQASGTSPKTGILGLNEALMNAVNVSLKSARNAPESVNPLVQEGDDWFYGKKSYKDYTQAAKWYQRAAEKGVVEGQKKLGYLYLNGLGVPRESETAFKWYQLAAQAGDPEAQNSLGVLYQYGNGVTLNYPQALFWYIKATDQGNPDAQSNLGYMYLNGYVVKKDPKTALSLFLKAADQGNSLAFAYIGYCYQMGYEVSKDDIKAVEWYRKSAEAGNPYGASRLAYMYMYGYGVEKNQQEAMRWYERASQKSGE